MFKKKHKPVEPESDEILSEDEWPLPTCVNPFPDNAEEKMGEIRVLNDRLEWSHRAYFWVNIACVFFIIPALITDWGKIALMLCVFSSLFCAFEEKRDGSVFTDKFKEMVMGDMLTVNYDETALIAMRLAAMQTQERRKYRKPWEMLLAADEEKRADKVIDLFPRFGIDNKQYKEAYKAQQVENRENGVDDLTNHPDFAEIDNRLQKMETVTQLEISRDACLSVYSTNTNASPEWRELAAKCDELIARIETEGLNKEIDAEIMRLAERIVTLGQAAANDKSRQDKE